MIDKVLDLMQAPTLLGTWSGLDQKREQTKKVAPVVVWLFFPAESPAKGTLLLQNLLGKGSISRIGLS